MKPETLSHIIEYAWKAWAYRQQTPSLYMKPEKTTERAWKERCDTMAKSWNMRPRWNAITGDRPGSKPKTSESWDRSIRCMQSQWSKAYERFTCGNQRWKEWANNTASNGRKRLKRKPDRKAHLPDTGGTGA